MSTLAVKPENSNSLILLDWLHTRISIRGCNVIMSPYHYSYPISPSIRFTDSISSPSATLLVNLYCWCKLNKIGRK